MHLAASWHPRGLRNPAGLTPHVLTAVSLGDGTPVRPADRADAGQGVRRAADGDGWLFEPKWDGFRALVFRDGDSVYIQSRDLKPLDRYFPELAEPLRATLPERCVLDGEVVIAGDGALDFEALLLRIHPAASRVQMLAEESPACFVAWDLLALGDEDLRRVPQGERRQRLEAALADAAPPVHLTPATRDRAIAADWFERFEGAGLDGVVAKRLDAPYQPGKRAMLKIKHQRTADCVVAGFRWHKDGKGTLVGSLLLGLYDDEGVLHHVGITSSFTWDGAPSWSTSSRRSARARSRTIRGAAGPNGPQSSRPQASACRARRPLEPRQGPVVGAAPRRARRRGRLRPPAGHRFRHATTSSAGAPTSPPEDCRYDQLEETAPFELAGIFGADWRRLRDRIAASTSVSVFLARARRRLPPLDVLPPTGRSRDRAAPAPAARPRGRG